MRSLALLGLVACTAEPATTTEARWVSLSPAITDTIIALDAADALVAISPHCSQPPGRQRPRIGTLTEASPEAILALKPSLVLTSNSRHGAIAKLRSAGLNVADFPEGSMDEILANPGRIGAAIGRPQAGAALARSMAQKLKALAPKPGSPSGPRTLLIFATEGRPIRQLWAAGPGGWLGDLAARVGLENALQSGPSYAQISVEGLLTIKPELMVVLGASSEGAQAMAADVEALKALPGVDAKRVHLLSGEALLRPGPRLIELASALAALR